jgi:filamentous hemagglutinin family protein
LTTPSPTEEDNGIVYHASSRVSRVLRDITGSTVGTGSLRGDLFHSFGRFNLATGEQANFQSTAAIQNILAQVTGGFPSSIDGLISTNNPAVNLFLLNTAGILFGPNTRLAIGGSFLATTANAFQFSDGREFSATNPQAAPLLTLNVPYIFQA